MILSDLYGCETWSFILWNEHRLRVFEKRMLRGIFEPKGKKWLETGENYIIRIFTRRTLRQIVKGRLHKGK